MPKVALAYGDSGSGKTTICVSLAKFFYEMYGLTTRLISIEGWDVVSNEGLISNKIVSAYNVAGKKRFLDEMRQLSRGWWPKVFKEEYNVKDSDGVETGETKVGNVRRLAEDKEALAKVGMYFIETTDGIADGYMRYIIDEETADKPIGPQKGAGRHTSEGGESLAGNSEGHYNIVQTEVHNLMTRFEGLSNVKLIFWTSHTGKGVEEKTKDPCYCPLLVGNAKNALMPSWVGDCFHLEDTPRVMDGEGNIIQEKSVRAFYESHRDVGLMEGPKYLAKSRIATTNLDELWERFPGGYVQLGIGEGEGLDQFYRWEKEKEGSNNRAMKEWKERIDAGRKGT